MHRRDEEYVGKRTDPPGRRKKGRPKRRFAAAFQEDMWVISVTEEDAEDGVRWREVIHCGSL